MPPLRVFGPDERSSGDASGQPCRCVPVILRLCEPRASALPSAVAGRQQPPSQ